MSEIISKLEMKKITKKFPGVLACNNIDIYLKSGEILALLGENGAGKTTLMNVLFGLYQPEHGKIFINDKQVIINSPSTAFKYGIGMVHQHFMLVPNLTVVENVALGLIGKRIFKLDLNKVRKRIEEVSKEYGLSVNPNAYIWQLSVGEQQRVELIKVLCLGANLLILDEPTAALTPQETDELIVLLKQMAEKGRSIIFISHKLNEVKAVSNRVCVLRNGSLVYEGKTQKHSVATLAEKMAGREIYMPTLKEKSQANSPILEIKNVFAKGNMGTMALDGLSLTVSKGEIVGIAGVSGNGQKELADVINGISHIERGKILLNSKNIANLAPQQIINKGIGYIPEDRMHEGTIPSFSVKENIIMKDYNKKPLSKKMFLQNSIIEKYSQKLISNFDIKCPDNKTMCASLSGGNVQKVILARELSRKPKMLIAAYPIRGLDLGAAEYVHEQLLEARSENVGILLISEELDELLDICDRIAVIYEGKILEILDRDIATKTKLGLLMAGIKNEKKAI
ncbi:MAG: ABC transporter ATP-binding protein [Candidatus Tenebribacter davisii]|nr:ABC transporter ATP-binding protein [Candidatus Tenebribacter davisii]